MTLKYLLDTCVVSEFVKPRPEKKLMAWLNSIEADQVYLSVVTLGEIQRGISLKPASNRRTELEVWLNEDLMAQFADRILPLDQEVLITWGQMVAPLKALGKPMNILDSFIAATAKHHKMVLVTRNISDFENVAVSILNPWE